MRKEAASLFLLFFVSISIFPSHAQTVGSNVDITLGNDSNKIENLDVFYAQSIDSGISFGANLRVTAMSFDPNLVRRTDPPGSSQPFLGGYIQIAGGATDVHIIWADNRNACGNTDPVLGCLDQDVFTATITF